MNKYESILCLKSPKLLEHTSFNAVNNTLVDLESQTGQLSFVNKLDTRNKSSYKVTSLLENKKTKNKQNKKTRSKLFVDNDLSIVENELNTYSIDTINFARNSKNVKNQKNARVQNFQAETRFFNESRSVNEIYLNDLLTVHELADKLSVSSTDIIKWLFLKGISVTINQSLDISISTLVAEHYSFNVIKRDNKADLVDNNTVSNNYGRLRAPVITLLGHVDHGKTSLLRAIKQDSMLIQEAGSITQTIGSYEVFVDNDLDISKLIFLDTPGHEAFISMRKRGADITDLAVLVVSADDGLKPQTVEAIEYVQRKSLPFVVAINKIDKPEADLAKVKEQLSAFGIVDCNIGGCNNSIVPVSALNYENINYLLSSIISLAKSQKLKSDPSLPAEGTILEAHLSKQKGPVAQLLVQNGTLHVGDVILAGSFYGKVKAITNSLNRKTKFIESAALADVLCFAEVPYPGLFFKVVADEKIAKTLASSYISANHSTVLNTRISLDDANQRYVKKIIKQVNLIVKTSTQGTIDAIAHALSQLCQEKVQINLLLVASGAVSLKDIELAYATDSLVLTFGLNVSSGILHNAEKRSVTINAFNVIYDLIDCVKNYMLSFVDVSYEEQTLGCAEIKNLFSINKATVAGCFVKSGMLKKKSYFRIKRSEKNIYTGLIDSLKIVKDDVDEVVESNECGVMSKDYNSWQIGDILECYELKPLEKTL